MKRLTTFEKLIVILSIYVIVELYISSVITYSPTVSIWTQRIDFIICILFLYDFFSRLIKAKEKGSFLKYNWIDFISSIPTIGILRIGRIVRIIRVLRILRSGKVFYRFLDKNNSLSTFGYIVILNIFLILLASISLYHL